MTESHDPVRRYDFPERFSALPGAAAYRQGDSPVVRRLRGGVDDLHAVLPAAPARGLRVFARLRALAGPGTAPHSYRAPRACGGDLAARREHSVEARGRRGPDVADTGGPRYQRRAALFRAPHHPPPRAALVRAPAPAPSA